MKPCPGLKPLQGFSFLKTFIFQTEFCNFIKPVFTGKVYLKENVMTQKRGFAKILYTAIGFIIISVLFIILRVIPLVHVNVPEPYSKTIIIVESVVSVIYLLIIAGIYWTIRKHDRGKPINKELLVACGIIPLLIGLIGLDGVAAYWNKAETRGISIALLFSISSNIIAFVLIFIARYSGRYKVN